MSLAWFLYTIAILVATIVACSMSVMAWTLTGQRQWLVSASAFVVYAFELGIIFFNEYTGDKPYLDEYFKQGLSFIPLSITLCVALVTLWWVWVSMRVYAPVRRRHVVAFSLVVAAVLVAVAPGDATGDTLHNLLYWGIRDVLFIGGLLCGLWWRARRATENERSDIDRGLGRLKVILAMMLVMLCEDITFVALFRPDAPPGSFWHSFFWHLTQRNITENMIVLVCAVFLVRNVREMASIFARHPVESRASGAATLRSSIEARLPRFCDEFGMSDREREVLHLVLEDRTSQEIASELFISSGTVKAHLHRVYAKAGVGSRKELVTSFWRF